MRCLQMTQRIVLRGDFCDNRSGCGDFQPQAVEHDTLSLGLMMFVFPGQAGSHPAMTHVVEHDELLQSDLQIV